MRSFEELDRIMSGAAHYDSAPASKPHRSFEELDALMTTQKPKEHTIGERLGQLGRGVAEATGEFSDVASQGVLPAMLRAQQANRYILPGESEQTIENDIAREKIAQELPSSTMGQELPQRFEQAVGRELKPEEGDITGQVFHGAGKFLAPPYIGPMSAAKTIAGKILGHVVPAFTASTAIHATPKLSEEGTTASTVEDISKAILGGIAGGKAVHATPKLAEIANDIKKLASQGRFRPIERMKEKISEGITKTGGKILSMGSKEPEARGFELAAKHEVELPYNIGMGSRVQNYMANNLFKSIFTAQAYKDTIKKASESMINSVRKSIGDLGDSRLKPQEASTEYRTFLDSEYKSFKKQSGELYEKASKSLSSSDSVIPSHTAKSINSDNIRSLLESDIKSDATRKVSKVIGELADAWGIKPKGIDLSNLENAKPWALSQIADSLSQSKKPVSIKRLDQVRKELLRMVDYDPSVRGVQANLSRLASDITKDIESSSNKEFVNRWNVARKHYSDNMRNRFETDIARSIMTGEAPVEAFNKMTNVQNINILEKALGASEKGKEIFKDLSAAKVRQILEPVLEDTLKEGTSIRTGAMAKMFSKGEAKQEVLERLIGKESYSNLEEISEIANMFSKAGKDVLNTSGTAIAAKDMDTATAAVAGLIHGIFGLGISSAATTAATYIGSVKLLSHLASNKRFINEARNYAVARAKGQEKQAQSILKRLIDTAKKEQQSIKFAATEAISKSKEEENE